MGNTRLVPAVQQQKILDGKYTIPKIFLIKCWCIKITNQIPVIASVSMAIRKK